MREQLENFANVATRFDNSMQPGEYFGDADLRRETYKLEQLAALSVLARLIDSCDVEYAES